MSLPKSKLESSSEIIQQVERQCELEFSKFEPFYRSLGVCFLSHHSFWEPAGQPPRNLALALACANVPVVWFDGEAWRPTKKVVPKLPALSVRSLACLPGRRMAAIDSLSQSIQRKIVAKAITELGGNPILWIQGGPFSSLTSHNFQYDVFSFFDEIHHYPLHDPILKRSRLLTTQNEYARQIFSKAHPTLCLFPAMSVRNADVLSTTKIELPDGFPKRRMGYFGSCFFDYFDYELLERLLVELPDWGFVIGGRVDAPAQRRIQDLSVYKNFFYFPWVPQNQIGSYWKLIDVCLLLYRPHLKQQGAFVSKVLESVYYGVPMVGRLEPKTADLAQFFPMVQTVDGLISAAVQQATQGSPNMREALARYAYLMNPKHQLAIIGEALASGGRDGQRSKS